MGCARGRLDLLADLAAGAEALVHQPLGAQALDGRVVQLEALALTDDRTVPVEPDGREVGQLLGLVLRSRPTLIEVFDTHQEAGACGTR